MIEKQMIFKKLLDKLDSQFEISDKEIETLAYSLWQKDGEPQNRSEYYWNKAKQSLSKQRKETLTQVLSDVFTPELNKVVNVIDEKSQVFVDKTLSVLRNSFGNNKEIFLPEGTRYHSENGRNAIAIVEHAPQVRILSINKAYHRQHMGSNRTSYEDGPIVKFRLALPYVVFKLHYTQYQQTKISVGFRNTPIKSLKDNWGLNILPNTSENNECCCPYGRVHNNLFEAIEGSISNYWQSVFRYSLHTIFPNNPEFKSFEAWEKATAKDSLFVLKTEWKNLGSIVNINSNNQVPELVSQGFQSAASEHLNVVRQILKIKS